MPGAGRADGEDLARPPWRALPARPFGYTGTGGLPDPGAKRTPHGTPFPKGKKSPESSTALREAAPERPGGPRYGGLQVSRRSTNGTVSPGRTYRSISMRPWRWVKRRPSRLGRADGLDYLGADVLGLRQAMQVEPCR